MRASRRAIAALAAAVALTGCDPETIQTTVGEGGFEARSRALSVGDTMTVRAGVRFNDGTFVRDTFARYSATPSGVATIGATSGLLQANSSGVVTVTATLRNQLAIDTTFVVQ